MTLRKSLANTLGITYEIFDGFVVAVHDDHTCDVKVFDDDDSVITGVSLRSVADGEDAGIVVIPAIDSHAVLAKIEGAADYTLIKSSRIDKVIINCEDVLINNGENEGLVKVTTLTDKINTLENSVNVLKNIITAWVPVASDGGAALKTALTSWATETISTTTKTELQNNKVKH